MRPTRPILLYVPALLVEKLNKHLSDNKPDFKYDRMYFYYTVHYITVQKIRNKNKEFVEINMRKMADATVYNIGKYLKILKIGEFIIVDEHYEKGKKSKGYKLNSYYLKGITEIEIAPSTKIFKKIIARQRLKRSHNNRLEPHLRAMNERFMGLELDYTAAFNWVKNNIHERQWYFHFTAINLIRDKRLRYFHRNRTNNRLDTNLTTLKSELRQFLIGDLVSIDLKNSQPFFLSVLLNWVNDVLPLSESFFYFNVYKVFGKKAFRQIVEIRQKSEKANLANLNKFSQLALEGKLYDGFKSLYPGDLERNGVKEIMFKVLFSKNEIYKNYRQIIPYKDEKKVFESVFPFVAGCIKELKCKNHAALAIYLQSLESLIFIDHIAKKLVESGIIPLTIHDSIIVERISINESLSIVETTFSEMFGEIPTFHIKPLA